MPDTFAILDALISDTDWSYDDELDLLNDDITLIANQLRSDETKKMVIIIEVSFITPQTTGYSANPDCMQRTIKRQLSEPIEIALNRPSPTMWDSVLHLFSDKLDRATTSYLAKAKSPWDYTFFLFRTNIDGSPIL